MPTFLSRSFRSNESVAAFRVVSVGTLSTAQSTLIELAETSTAIGIGIIQDAVSSAGAANVITLGESRASCGASVSAGSILTWQTATGQVIEAIASASSVTARLIGQALFAGSTNSVIKIIVNPQLIPNI